MSLLLQLGRLASQKGSDGDFAMNFDLNGRILKQINGPDTLHYAYNPQSYQLNHVSGSTSRAPDRDMSMEGNFQWLPQEFRRLEYSDTLGEKTLAQTQLYGPEGVRTATLDWKDSNGVRELLGIRSDVVIGGRKRSEIREDYSGADSVPNVNEYTMIQGRSSIVGRVRPDSLSEWYVKDYQGSLALSVVGNGYGTALTYAPYGAQQLLRSDGVPPAEQYTGKEWDGAYEFYYFGARFLDPVLGMWVVPDPAGQFANPYGFGGDPVNYTDPDGRFLFAAIVVGATLGAWFTAVNEGNTEQILMGGIAGGIGGAAGGFVGAPVALGGLGYGATASAVVGSTASSFATFGLTQGNSEISTSFGSFSINWSQGNVGYLGKKGNSVGQNIGYGLGAMANIADAVNLYGAYREQKTINKNIDQTKKDGMRLENGTLQGTKDIQGISSPTENGSVSFGELYSDDVDGYIGSNHTHFKDFPEGRLYADFAVPKDEFLAPSYSLDNTTWEGSHFQKLDAVFGKAGTHSISYPHGDGWFVNYFNSGSSPINSSPIPSGDVWRYHFQRSNEKLWGY